MKITRRNFVQVFGSAAAIIVSGGGFTSALGSTAGRSPHFSSTSKTLFGLNSTDAEILLGRPFTATSPDNKTFQLVLTEVNNLARKANAQRGYSGESFSMIFECLGGERMPQGVYQLGAPEMGEVPALIVPTTRDSREYEIVVNHVTR